LASDPVAQSSKERATPRWYAFFPLELPEKFRELAIAVLAQAFVFAGSCAGDLRGMALLTRSQIL